AAEPRVGVFDPGADPGPGLRRHHAGQGPEGIGGRRLGARRRDRWGGEARAPDATTQAFRARVATRWIRASDKQLTTTPARRKRRILVVEDDAPIRMLIAEVCRLQGHDVLEAGTG